MKPSSPTITVDTYLAALSPEVRAVLETLRQTILATAPGAEEKISYHMPMYHLQGRPLIAFAAFKRHCALYMIGPILQAKFAKQLQDFDTDGTKATVRFTPAKPLPPSLIRSLVKARQVQSKEPRP